MSREKKYNFYQDVYDVVHLIPSGRVTTYGAIAAYLGAKKSSRLVGWAMNNAHDRTPEVPAHRVVNRNGLLSGKHHFESEKTMEDLLNQENVQVEDDQVVNFKKLFWDPAVELAL